MLGLVILGVALVDRLQHRCCYNPRGSPGRELESIRLKEIAGSGAAKVSSLWAAAARMATRLPVARALALRASCQETPIASVGNTFSTPIRSALPKSEVAAVRRRRWPC